MFEALLVPFKNITRDEQVRCMGWGLLLLWTLSITYMTRDFWFPSAFGLPPLSERVNAPVATPPTSRKKLSVNLATGFDMQPVH